MWHHKRFLESKSNYTINIYIYISLSLSVSLSVPLSSSLSYLLNEQIVLQGFPRLHYTHNGRLKVKFAVFVDWSQRLLRLLRPGKTTNNSWETINRIENQSTDDCIRQQSKHNSFSQSTISYKTSLISKCVSKYTSKSKTVTTTSIPFVSLSEWRSRNEGPAIAIWSLY